METKRRLPVLKTASDEDEATARPPWQWVGFGTLAIFVVWTPLAFMATWAASRLQASGAPPPVSLAVVATGLALAALAGGFLVGRWGAAGVGVREAAMAGFAAALVASVLALGAPGAWAGALASVPVAVPFAAWGGRLGLRRRGGVS